MMMPILEVNGLSKRFGGVLAVDSVGLSVEPGQIFSIIGANGAGKTTLFNLITGFVPASAGRVRLTGKDVSSRPAFERVRLGMARTFQTPQLFGDLTVRENVMSATYPTQLSWRRVLGMRPTRSDVEACDSLLELVGLQAAQSTVASELPYGHRRRLEIARAMMTKPSILMLDEPAAGMIPSEVDELNDLLRQIRKSGCAVLLVEHNMRVVMSISDRVAAMEFGRIIATGSPAEIRASPEVIRAYLGESA